MESRSYLVLYRHSGDDNVYSETTSRLELTIERLEAQGYVIIDIIDL